MTPLLLAKRAHGIGIFATNWDRHPIRSHKNQCFFEWNPMKSYQIPWNHIKFHESQHSQRIPTSFSGQKKQPAVAGGPCLLGRHGLIGRGHRSPTTRLHGSQGVLFHPGSRKMARKGSQNHWESLENVMKCHEMSHISSDIYWYLRYISDISCLGRFVRWIRRSCNDVMVLDVDLGVILGMTGYLDIRKVGRSQPTKRGPLWHGTWWKFKGRMSRQDWERLALNLAGGFQPHGYPQSIHVNKMFHYKPLINHPAIWGYPFFAETAQCWASISSVGMKSIQFNDQAVHPSI